MSIFEEYGAFKAEDTTAEDDDILFFFLSFSFFFFNFSEKIRLAIPHESPASIFVFFLRGFTRIKIT